MKMAYAVVGGTSSDDFVTTKESRRFPEMLALPPLVSIGIKLSSLSSHVSKDLISVNFHPIGYSSFNTLQIESFNSY